MVSLETSKVRLDGALSNLINLQVSLFIAGELDWMTFKHPFQLGLFYDSMKSKSTDWEEQSLRAALQRRTGGS